MYGTHHIFNGFVGGLRLTLEVRLHGDVLHFVYERCRICNEHRGDGSCLARRSGEREQRGRIIGLSIRLPRRKKKKERKRVKKKYNYTI